MLKNLLLQLLVFAVLIVAHPTSAYNAVVKRNIHDLKDWYDFIIVGGGTSGLVVANRLSEDASKSVLVIEPGDLADEPCIWMPKTLANVNISATECRRHVFNLTSEPIEGLDGFVLTAFRVGMAVGGSSAVNGMVFDRASKADYDAWEALGNPGWGWDGLFEYFKKSASFVPPDEESTKKYSYTWDERAYGKGPGPIWASLPPFEWPATKIAWDAWTDLNISTIREHAIGNAVGRYWAPASQNPFNQTRSYARYGYYDPIRSRPNYHLLVGHKAEKVELSKSADRDGDFKVQGVVISEQFPSGNGIRRVIRVKKEVVLAAGAVHTPQILQVSGIGPRGLLREAGIEVKVELDGVGQNLQDHAQVMLSCNFTKDLWPNPAALTSNATFVAESQKEYDEHKTGPLSLSLGTSFTFLPLSTVDPNHSQFLSNFSTQAPSSHLPPTSSPSVLAGYKAQQNILSQLLSSSDTATYEASINGVCSRALVILKPLSHGSITINTTSPLSAPVINFRTFSNPLDIQQAVSFIRYTRRWMNSPTLAALGPVELAPGANVTADVEFEKYVRATTYPTSFHPAGTAAMMPRGLGGVVDSELRVYDVKGLSVVDASIMPLIPAAHLSATVYAVAEKAADIIKVRN